MVVPAVKESYFLHADCLIHGPTQEEVIISTNLSKKYLVNIKQNVLSAQSRPTLCSAGTGQRIYSSAQQDGVYALGTSSGVGICQWEGVPNATGMIETDTSFYSLAWVGTNILACGDNGTLIEVDGRAQQKCRDYTGHSSSVNVVKVRDDNSFVSAGYDGICRIWDRRTGGVSKQFTPSSWASAARPKLGSHITALDVWDDWVVVGGGPNLSLWYMKEDAGVSLLDMGGSVPSIAKFAQDTIIAAGDDSFIYHWNLSGKLKYKVTSKLSRVTDLHLDTVSRNQPFLIAAGSPAELNVFMDLGYLSHTVPYLG